MSHKTGILFTILMILLFLTANIASAKSRGGSIGGYKKPSTSGGGSTYKPYKPSTGSTNTYSRTSTKSYYYSSRSTYTYSSSRTGWTNSAQRADSYTSRGNYNTSYGNNYYSSTARNYYSSSGNYYYSSPSYSYPSTNIPSVIYVSNSGFGGGSVILLLIIVGVVAFIIVRQVKKGKGGGAGSGSFQLYVAHVGFFSGKGDLETKITALVDSIDTSTNAGLLALLREISILIQRNNDLVRWYHYEKSSFGSDSLLESNFQKALNKERMKLDEEEYSDIDGREVKNKQDGPALEEVIFFSIVIGTTAGLDLPKQINFESFSKLVSFFTGITEDTLYGINITWNIMDRDDMIEKFPEVRSSG